MDSHSVSSPTSASTGSYLGAQEGGRPSTSNRVCKLSNSAPLRNLVPSSRKRVRQTYSLKASKRARIGETLVQDVAESSRTTTVRPVKAPEPNSVLATPIVRRLQGHWTSPLVPEPDFLQAEMVSKPGRCYHSHESCGGRCCYYEDQLAKHRTTTTPSIFALYESIYRALDALLRATAASEAKAAKPKSLMAMCLRKVPDYLVELEAWKVQELEEKGTASAFDESNTSFEVYSDLEWLGTGNNGWKHLAIVLQSHGIRIVKDAISERLLSDNFTILLVDLCCELKPLNDRRQLLEAAVTRQHRKPFHYAAVHVENAWRESASVLQLLGGRSEAEQRESRLGSYLFKARLTTDLLSKHLIPQEWLLSKVFSNMWSSQMRTLTSRTAFYDAIPFFIASIQLYCNQIQGQTRKPTITDASDTSPQQALINALASVSTIVLLGQETLQASCDDGDNAADSSWRDQTRQLCRRAEYILRASLAEAIDSHGRPSRRCSTYVLLLAVYLMNDQSSPDEFGSREKQMLADVWTATNLESKRHTYRQYYEATMALMAWISRGCTRRNSAKQTHSYLVKLCDKLEAACPGVKALSTLRVDAAFYLYDLTGDIWDLNFAERLAVATAAAQSSSSTTSETPRKTTTAYGGFRWDEGISEWVTVTPEMKRRQQPQRRPQQPVLERVTRGALRRVSPMREDDGVPQQEVEETLQPRISSDSVASSGSPDSESSVDDNKVPKAAGRISELVSSSSDNDEDDEPPVSKPSTTTSKRALTTNNSLNNKNLSKPTASSNPSYQVNRTTPAPNLLGTNCHAKPRPRLITTSLTHTPKPGVVVKSSKPGGARAQRSAAAAARGSPVILDDADDDDDDLDELSFQDNSQADQENRPPPVASSHSAKAKPRRPRRSLVSLQGNGWGGVDSGDELGM